MNVVVYSDRYGKWEIRRTCTPWDKVIHLAPNVGAEVVLRGVPSEVASWFLRAWGMLMEADTRYGSDLGMKCRMLHRVPLPQGVCSTRNIELSMLLRVTGDHQAWLSRATNPSFYSS